jgi:hypothetical protein
MSAFIERTRNFFKNRDKNAEKQVEKQVTPLVNAELEGLAFALNEENRAKWDGEDGYRYIEWRSPDGTRKIFTSVCEGPDYGGLWMKDVNMYALTQLGGWEMMRAQWVLQEGSSKVEQNLYFEVLIDDEQGHIDTNLAYFGSDGGKMKELHQWGWLAVPPQYSFLTLEEYEKACRRHLKEKGMLHLDDLPPVIDIEATIALFMAKLEKGDFSPPRIIAKENLTEE